MIEYTTISNSEIASPKIFFFIERIRDILNRKALLQLFTPCQRMTLTEIPKNVIGSPLIKVTGKVHELAIFKELYSVHVPKNASEVKEFSLTDPTSDMIVYGVHFLPGNEETIILYELIDNALDPPFAMSDKFFIEKGMIDNYQGSKKLLTDVGKFFLNQLLLVDPFGTLIPYRNSTFDPKDLDRIVSKFILTRQIGRKEYNTYMTNGYWYGQDGSIATATWSEKSLTTDPDIIKKRDVLFEKYKDSLDDPLVLANIEKEVVELDRQYLKGDSSEPFYAVTSGKTFNEQRKKMYLTFGLTVAYDKHTGKYEFVSESLAEGWSIENIHVGANDTRRGSHGRGIDTAKGGEETKKVSRIFQDVRITEDDCGSKKGIHVTITKYTSNTYFGKYLVDGTMITEENVDQFIGKEIEIRHPQYCKTNPGFCFTCCGERYRSLDMKAIGMNAVTATSSMTSVMMKAMHVSGIQVVNINNFHRFLR